MFAPYRAFLFALLVCSINPAALYADNLWEAIGKGDAASVKKMLAADPKLVQQLNPSGSSPLHVAARSGHIEIVKLLLDAKANIHAKAEDDRTPLHFATTKEIVELLLARGADVNAPTKFDRFTVLHRAAQNGDVATVALLLAKGAKVDGGWTGKDFAPSIPPLHFAAQEGKVDVARILLAKGAKVDAPRYGTTTTPLSIAAERKDMAMVKLLLRKGADPNYGHAFAEALRTGQTKLIQLFVDKGANFKKADLLLYATVSGKTEVVALALAAGADVNAAERDGMTALFYAARSGWADIVALLLDKGANPNIAFHTGTPLHATASVAIAELLLQRGAKVDAVAKNGQTPLVAAVYQGHKAVAELLERKGAKHTLDTLAALGHDAELRQLLKTQPLPKLKDDYAYLPLHLAARFGQTKTALVLLKHGVDVNAARGDGETALHLAAQHGQLAMVELLLDHKAQVNAKLKPPSFNSRQIASYTPLMGALDRGHAEVVRVLAKAGGLPAITGAKNARAWLLHVAQGKHLAILKLLFQEGAPLDTKLPPNNGTALHLAAELGDLDMVRWLVDKKADVKARDNSTWSPLQRAIDGGHLAVVEYLLTCGGDLNDRALHMAAGRGHLAVAKLLLDKGADLHAVQDFGFYKRTVLGMAVASGQLEVAKMLHAKGASVKQDVGLVHAAAFHGHRDMVAFLLDKGIGVEEFLADGFYLYYWRFQPHQLSLLTFFAEKDPAKFKGLNAGVTIEEINGKKPFAIIGGRPLQAAVAGQQYAVATLLLEKGASAKVLFPDGSTLLHLAAALGDIRMVELLVKHGAEVQTRDRSGRTPLQVAAEREETEVMALLKKHGAKD